MKTKKALISLFLIVTTFLILFITSPLLGGGVSKALASGITYGNATSVDLLSGKIATTDSGQITGTITNKVGSGTVIIPNSTDQAIPAGYYDGSIGSGKVPALLTSGDNVWASSDGEIMVQNINQWVGLKGIKVLGTGSVRVKFDTYCSTGGSCQVRIYINGVAVGTTRVTTSRYVTYSEDFTVSANDSINVESFPGANNVYVRNFRLCTAVPLPGYLM